MSYIDALIAQGGTQFNLAQTMQDAQTLKTNDLLNLGRQAALDRLPVKIQQEDAAYERETLFRASNEFVRAYESGNRDAAIQVVNSMPDTGRLGQVKQGALAALQTPDPNDDLPVLQQARMFTQIGMDEGFFQGAGSTESPSNVREYEFWQQLTPEQQQQYLQVKRATTGIGEVGGVTGIIDKEANTFVPVQTPTGPATLQGEAAAKATLTAAEKGAGRTAELQSELSLKPDVEAAVKTAVVNAEALATRNQTQKSNDVTWSIYNTGMSGLADALGNTDTGPFVGRLPAITANQQISDGAIAAMAPVMKQMFRAAGEGIFTDKDQELLLQMIPKRTDRAEARLAMLQNIDAIVRAKLGITGQATTQGNILNFDENGNIVQ